MIEPPDPDLVIARITTRPRPGVPNVGTLTLPFSIQQAWSLAKGLQNAVQNLHYSNCDALTMFTQDLADRNPTPKQSVQALSVLIPNTVGSKIALKYWSSDPVVMYAGGTNGFSSPYQNTTNDGPAGNGDQAHHFAAFFEYGYLYGYDGGVGAAAFEAAEAASKGTSINSGDIRLGNIATAMGATLAAGGSVGDVSSQIRSLCDH